MIADNSQVNGFRFIHFIAIDPWQGVDGYTDDDSASGIQCHIHVFDSLLG